MLLAVGLSPLNASIANNVALVGCWPGSALASQTELRGRGAWVRRWAVVAAAGAAVGSELLLHTPSGVFARVVPFLVLIGSLALACEPRIQARRRRREDSRPGLGLGVGIFVLSLYNGYFGAGSGVMILTLVLVLVEPHLPTANALKNMLIGAAVLVSAVIFVVSGSVAWWAAAPLGVGMLGGSRVGPVLARRLPPGLLRWLIVVLGVVLAVDLWVNPHG